MSDGREYRTYFKSEHLRGVDLPKDGHTYRITAEVETTMEDSKTAPMLTLRDATSDGITWITNVINCECMARMFGSKLPEKWVGRLITIHYDPTVKRGKEVVGGIRVTGSPDLTRTITFDHQENAHKRAKKITLIPTGKKPKQPANVDPVTGEVGDGGEAEEAGGSTQRPLDGAATSEGDTDPDEGFGFDTGPEA